MSKSPTLESVRERFETWRSRRKKKTEPIPSELWQAAADLCNIHPISHVCKYLRLSFTDMKKHITPTRQPSVQFMEFDMSCLAGAWHLQCERADGAKLRLSGSGQPPAMDRLLREFLL